MQLKNKTAFAFAFAFAFATVVDRRMASGDAHACAAERGSACVAGGDAA